jgi:hypothetical protein
MDLRGQSLRKILDLPDQGHVLGNRKLRNYLERFDEELDAWAADKSGWDLVALDNFLFLDESVNLRELNGALENILPIVTHNKDIAFVTARKAPLLHKS